MSIEAMLIDRSGYNTMGSYPHTDAGLGRVVSYGNGSWCTFPTICLVASYLTPHFPDYTVAMACSCANHWLRSSYRWLLPWTQT